MYLSAQRSTLLASIFEHLTHGYGSAEVRARIGADLLALLDADYYASFVWDPATRRFVDRVSINMDETNLDRYDAYFQFHDPITWQLQQRRVPTLVTEVMPQASLMRTEFFNDFLHRDGLYWGVNLYAWHGTENIGDLRIWRRRSRGNFDREALELLELVRPAFTNAMHQVLVADTAPSAATTASVHLTTRERDVADLIAEGLTDKQIARRLTLALPTVRTHVGRVFEKFGVHNRAALCRAVLSGRHGL